MNRYSKDIINSGKDLLTKGAKLVLEQGKINGQDIKALMNS
jgi:hypothetical protein